MSKKGPNFIVGIGGSAGGLKAYQKLLEAMPASTGMAFVIVCHLYPGGVSYLPDLLSKRTSMPVLVASTAMTLQANHVYVLPPNADLYLENGSFRVVSPRSRGNVQVDVFFKSLAEAMGTRAIGIVLSGYDGDGTDGCKHIKAHGGTTFAQDMSADVEFMPLSAQDAGCVDFVLPPDKIPDELQRLVRASIHKRRA